MSAAWGRVDGADDDYSPAPVSAGLALAAGVLAAGVGGTSTLGLAAGLAGLAGLGWGLFRGRRGAVTVGALCSFAGALFAGTAGAGPLAVGVGAVAAVAAYDAGRRAVRFGRTVAPGTDTLRVELLGAYATATAALLAGGVGFVAFVVRPVAGALALSALLIVALGLSLTLRPD
jgi:hypothetical protein